MSSETPQTSATILKYNPQLDGLRFFAVLFVVAYHWLPSISHIPEVSLLGGMVNFFFVLSSYLITTILFSAREKHSALGIPKLRILRVFLMRRTIRIFPAYYCFLIIVILLPMIGSGIREHAGMYFAYLSNFQVFHNQQFPKVGAHIWTLAVEEQFYLLWPLVILFVPQRHFLKTFIAVIIGCVILRMITYVPTPAIPQIILTQYCVDAFAVGAILAYKTTMATEKEKRILDKVFTLLLYTGIPVALIIIFTQNVYLSFIVNRTLFSIISLKVIEGAVNGYDNKFGKFLERKTVVGIGRISYGIYLYHLLVPVVFWKIYKVCFTYGKVNHPAFFTRHKAAISLFQRIVASEAFCFVLYSVLVIMVARLSWKYVEYPFTRFKVSYESGSSIRKKMFGFFNKPIA